MFFLLLHHTDWFTFGDIKFGPAGTVGQMKILFSSEYPDSGQQMEVRLGDQNGAVIGTFVPFHTGGWSNFVEAYFTLDAAEEIEGLQQRLF